MITRFKVARLVATWFGCGYVPKAPGTAGTIGAIPLYLVLFWYLGPIAVFVAAVILTIVGILAANIVAKEMRLKDPQIIVIDEVAGVMLALVPSPFNWRAILFGVVAFRIFDSVKVWPANWAEKKLPGGYGIVLDDIFAGAWVAAIFCALRYAGYSL